MGSSRRRCCCKNLEGCDRCTTPTSFFGAPPFNVWCNIIYGFTFSNFQNSLGGIDLPTIKSNYTFDDYIFTTTQSQIGSGCDCDPNSQPISYPVKGGLTLFYDVNLLRDPPGGNLVNPNFIGCTYDNRDIFLYDLEGRDVLTHINYIGMRDSLCPRFFYDQVTGTTVDCGIAYVPTDIEAFVAPLYGITQHTNAAFSCRFRACGFNFFVGQGVVENNFPPSWCDAYDLISDQNCPNQFLEGVTLVHADSYILKSIVYAPVIRTLDQTTPVPTPDCFYSLQEQNIPGSSNRKTPVLKTCYVPTVEEECRCQSALIIRIVGRAEQQFKKIIFEEEQIVGPGGELTGNRNFIAVGTTFISPGDEGYTPPFPVGKCEINLYYIGCIDDAIYGLPSPSERVFTLDAGIFDYEGIYEPYPCGTPGGPGFNPPRICNNTNYTFQSLPPFDICPNRPVNCLPNSATLSSNRVLPASFFTDLGIGIPEQITVKRLS